LKLICNASHSLLAQNFFIQGLTIMKSRAVVFGVILGLVCAPLFAAYPAGAKPRNCPDVDFYVQPNSFSKEKIGSLSEPGDLDIVTSIVEPNGQKWYHFRFFNLISNKAPRALGSAPSSR